MNHALGPAPRTIPAHPLAVTESGEPDWLAQRLLTRYYVAAGATGVAVGVHTTQFEIHDQPDLLRRAFAEAADVVGRFGSEGCRLVAGLCGDAPQALREAELSLEVGYHAALLCPYGMTDRSEAALLDRARRVAEIMPVIGFYMQESVGGDYLSPGFWDQLFEIPGVVGVKVAPFDRYRSLDVADALARSDRWADIALVTGNDDTIVSDLLQPLRLNGTGRVVRFSGGLLGQWAVGTRAAVELTARALAEREQGVSPDLLAAGTDLTALNQALFDPEHNFAGAVAGVNEMLRQQGLLASSRCLSAREVLSPGQAERIAQQRARHPHLTDDAFIAEHLHQWKRDVA